MRDSYRGQKGANVKAHYEIMNENVNISKKLWTLNLYDVLGQGPKRTSQVKMLT
jgi:hypothetical protein